MKPEVLFTGMVTSQLSSSGLSPFLEEYKTNMEEWSTRCWQTLLDANVDLRHTTLGLGTVAMQWQITKQMSHEFWYGLIVSQMPIGEFLIDAKRPESILFVNGIVGGTSSFLLAPESHFDKFQAMEINFVNDAGLFMFEKNLRNWDGHASFSYSVYDKSELLSDKTEKFDMIVAQSWDLYDMEFIEALIDNLNPGGSLAINGSNDSTTLYSSSYKWHPNYIVHKKLLESEGTTYHFPQFYGMTLFVKN
jgi:hypothetical protein